MEQGFVGCRASEALKGGLSKTVPGEVAVECGDKLGTFGMLSGLVRCHCPDCEGKKDWDVRGFEAHGGLAKNRKWKESLRVVVEGSRPVQLGQYLESCGLVTKRLPPQDAAAPLVALSGSQLPVLVAARAEKLQASISPTDLLPPEVEVVCAGVSGTFLTPTWSVRCNCSACGGGKTWTPSKWEGHCKPGVRPSSYARAICIAPGALPAVPLRTQPLPLRSFFRLHKYDLQSSRKAGQPPPLVPIK
ncbi:hypothetical protein GPECTOR_10g812 [Gonium pectorale]|uniref:Uncharacterized protein n=1 Tax=Gonium pectorale TaxID=33097 RepID=A0A150GQW9_GONPE|nr:hypothetical protein GPECTOR_10g812 [Gonium pectorale]|eukprot:KXZ52183.1 hypothetical protein GPECTOR_10g812 [Gonium pectorale]